VSKKGAERRINSFAAELEKTMEIAARLQDRKWREPKRRTRTKVFIDFFLASMTSGRSQLSIVDFY